MKQSFAEISVNTRLLYQRLRGLTHDEFLPYGELTALIDRDVQNGARSNLQSARNMAAREGVITDCVRGEGVKRLKDAEVAGLGDRTMKHIRRSARRTLRKMVAVDYAALANDAKVRHLTALSLLGAMVYCSGEKQAGRVYGAVQAGSAELPIGKTLALFQVP